MSKTCETCKHRGEPINTEKNMYWCECGKTCVNGSGWEGAKPMNELKPEDVMRALECWASHKPCDEDCPIMEYEGSHNCIRLTMENALALLREKDAEIERLTEERDKAQAICVQMGKLNQAEIAKARAEAIKEFLKAIEDAISNLEYNAKFKRKTVTVDMLLDQVNWVLHTIVPRRIKQVAADLLDDFPNCKISGCEAARKDCHIGCPYGK